MVDPVQAFILALIQGITEFLPISSSAHLILVPIFFDWSDQGLSFDVAVHIGTLFAICAYYRAEITELFLGVLPSKEASSRFDQKKNRKLAKVLLISTLPILLAGAFAHSIVENFARQTLIISISMIFFGILLFLADQRKNKSRDIGDLSTKDALVFGLFQVLALIPGASRSGITITAGLALGLSRDSSARFSFYMAIPVIAAAGIFKLAQAIFNKDLLQLDIFLIGISVSFISAFLVIAVFIRYVSRVGMIPFVVYRILLGVLLIIFYA